MSDTGIEVPPIPQGAGVTPWEMELQSRERTLQMMKRDFGDTRLLELLDEACREYDLKPMKAYELLRSGVDRDEEQLAFYSLYERAEVLARLADRPVGAYVVSTIREETL